MSSETVPRRVNGARLLSRIQRLGAVGALEGGGVCRLALSEADRQGRDLLLEWMQALKLEVSIDAIGNIIGVRPGQTKTPPVMTGSHIDSVATGGLYDGALGVLAGLEVIEVLNEEGMQTQRPVAVAAFSNEEGARFAPDMMGSLVYVGGMSLAEALAVEGIDGVTVGDALQRIGYAGDAACGNPQVAAYVELHVEQGPVLEQAATTIGVVEGVQGISWREYHLEGASNHAGTTPMALRQDSGFVAMAAATELRRLCGKIPGQLGTVGRLRLDPDLINVIPRQASFTVDLRNTDEAQLQAAESALDAYIQGTARAEGVKVSRRELARFAPVSFAPEVVSQVEHWARQLGHSARRLPSGAGHDAQMLARVCPSAMIFIPSVGGISHNIKEFSHAADIQAGADVLLNVLLELAG